MSKQRVSTDELYKKLRPKDRKKAKGLIKAVAKGKLKSASMKARIKR